MPRVAQLLGIVTGMVNPHAELMHASLFEHLHDLGGALVGQLRWDKV